MIDAACTLSSQRKPHASCGCQQRAGHHFAPSVPFRQLLCKSLHYSNHHQLLCKSSTSAHIIKSLIANCMCCSPGLARCVASTATRSATKRPTSLRTQAITSPATVPGGMQTATTGSLAALTTCSTCQVQRFILSPYSLYSLLQHIMSIVILQRCWMPATRGNTLPIHSDSTEPYHRFCHESKRRVCKSDAFNSSIFFVMLRICASAMPVAWMIHNPWWRVM